MVPDSQEERVTRYGCPCPFGCWRLAAGDKVCENCRMGFHGRFCQTFTPRPADEDVWTARDCATCGGDKWDHDPLVFPRFNLPPPPEPHAPMGTPVPASDVRPKPVSHSSLPMGDLD